MLTCAFPALVWEAGQVPGKIEERELAGGQEAME